MNPLTEFSKSYLGTYVAIKENGKYLPFHVMDVHGSSKQIEGSVLTDMNSSWTPKTIKFDTSNLLLSLPPMGLINAPEKEVKYAILFSLIPERQWKKGLVDKNLYVVRLGENKALTELRRSDIHAPSIMWNLYNPTYNKLSDFNPAVDVSMALSSKFAVIKQGEDVVVSFNGNLVGYVMGGEIVLLRTFSHLEDLVRKFTYCKVE